MDTIVKKVKVASGNRITIPKVICEKYGIKEDDILRFVSAGDHFKVYRLSNKIALPKDFLKK